METVTSQDGTRIAYDRAGSGPALILVGGATALRRYMGDFVTALAPHFTVFNYDRRGRGDSGDTQPYAVEREVEDIAALAAVGSANGAGGGRAYLFGWSSGAVLALEAASRLPGRIRKLALYEPPFILDGSRPPVPADYVPHLNELIGAGKRAEAVEYFFKDAMLLPPEMLAGMQASPMWSDLLSVSHTIAYDGLVMGDTMRGRPLDTTRWAGASLPVLVVTGGASPAFFHTAARALAAGLPHAEHLVLPGQTHGVEPAALAPALVEFFHD
jgi:pimeloyl-ACP methyl ester carboxylesterase